jgi:hypothetical protein
MRFLFVFALLLPYSILMAAESKVDLKTKPEMVKRMRLVNSVATIESMDLAKRRVTVRRADGVHVTVKVDENVSGLDQFKAGDEVKVRYYESVSYQLVKVDPKEVQKETTIQTSDVPPGKNPKLKAFKETTIIATIQEIDPQGRYVKLKGPDGEFSVPVRDPKNLKFVKVDDQVKITYAESLAVALEKTQK